jgi:hypothetical protein
MKAFSSSSDVPLTLFNFNFDPKRSQQSYCNLMSGTISLSVLLLVKVVWVWIFVLGPKASHFPTLIKCHSLEQSHHWDAKCYTLR